MPVHKDNGVVMPRSEAKDEEIEDEPTTVSIRQPTFDTSPAIKAARTRAFRHNFQAFTTEEAEALSPANVFVKLKISSDKLRQSGIPIIRTRWENEVARKNITCDGVPDLVVTQPMSDKINTGEQIVSRNGQDNIKLEVASVAVEHSINDGATATEKLANHFGSPRSVGHVSQSFINHESSFLTPQSVPQREQLEPTSTSNHTDNLAITADRLDQINESLKLSENIGIQGLIKSEKPLISRYLAVKSPVGRQAHHSRTVAGGKITPTKRARVNRAGLDSPSTFVKSARKNTVKQIRSTPDSDNLSTTNAVLHQSTPRSTTKRQSATRSRERNRSTRYLHGIDNTTKQLATPLLTPDPDNPDITYDMAPVRDPNNVDSSLKDAIQKLYEVQSQVHGFVPETQPLLIDKMAEVANSLAHLQKLTSPTLSPNNPIHKNRIAPEVIDYVDDSRNPDIYNREFVELVQRGNAVMNGKQQAFKDFSLTFAQALRARMPELSEHVNKIMKNAGLDETKASSQRREDSGANGDIKIERKADGRTDDDSGVNGA